VGALGFEPRSAGFHRTGSDPVGIVRVNAPVSHHRISKPVLFHSRITGAREDTELPHTPTVQCYTFRIFCARLRRLIFFLRHFHLCLPRFFQARELLFIRIPRLLFLPSFSGPI
jgi:hypothetical protein